MTDTAIGIDVGTSACKAVLLREDGLVLGAAVRSYHTRVRLDGEVTQSPNDWLTAMRDAIRECLTVCGDVKVSALAVTAPAHVAVLSDQAGRPLARSLLAFDARPAAMAAELAERYGPVLFESTFVNISSGATLAQLAWLHRQSPELWARIRWVMPQKDWIRFRLTGVAAVDPSDAAGTVLMDQRSTTWIRALLEDVGLAPDQLPPIVPSTSPGGNLSRQWARTLGIPSGIPVVVGATDTACELVSIGARDPGSSLVKIASTGTVVAVTSQPQPHPRLLTYPHVEPGRWYSLAATNNAASAYRWLRETLFAPAAWPAGRGYQEIDALAAGVPPGADGLMFLPYLQGERTPHWDPFLRGAFVGLSSVHGPAHFARAVLEGVAFSLRDCCETMTDAGFPIDRPALGGGGISSPLWTRILVSVLGVSGSIREPQGPAVGAAILALSAGSARPLQWRPTAATSSLVHPVAIWTARYDLRYRIYREAAERLRDVSHELAERVADRPPEPRVRGG